MPAPACLHANDDEDLHRQLTQWGPDAPERLDRRGRQRDLERWIFNGFLRALDASGTLDFPVSVCERENPDFQLTSGCSTLGIEVTEAVDPAKQVRWTEEAREEARGEGPRARQIDLEDPSRPARVAEMVRTAFEKKLRRCSKDVDAVLMYLNTEAAGFETPETILSWLDGAIPPESRFRFLWIFDGSKLFEMKAHTHLAPLHAT